MLVAESEFEEMIVATCKEVAQLLLFKNRKYSGLNKKTSCYRCLRQRYQMLYDNPRIPFDLHITEKRDRYIDPANTDEDSALDVAGTAILEIVCRRLDD